MTKKRPSAIREPDRESKVPNPSPVQGDVALTEEELEQIEADPAFQKMMEDSLQAEREGRVFPWRDVKEAMRQRGRARGKIKEILPARQRHG